MTSVVETKLGLEASPMFRWSGILIAAHDRGICPCFTVEYIRILEYKSRGKPRSSVKEE